MLDSESILRRLNINSLGVDQLPDLIRSRSLSALRSTIRSNSNQQLDEMVPILNDNNNNDDNNNNHDNNNNDNNNQNNNIRNLFPTLIRPRLVYPLILFILIKVILGFLPKLLCYLLLYLYLQKTNSLLREKLMLKGIKRISSLLQLAIMTVITFFIAIKFMETFFKSEHDVHVVQRLMLFNKYVDLNIVDLFFYILITDTVISAISLTTKIFTFIIILFQADMKCIISNFKMSFANIGSKLQKKNSENINKDKEENSSTILNKRSSDDIESGTEEIRRRRTTSSSAQFVENSSNKSDGIAERELEMKKENLLQIYLKKIASITDLLSLIYRSIVVAPCWIVYLKLGSGGDFLISFFIVYKITDIIRKLCALYETIMHFIRGTIEFGKPSSPLEIQNCDGCPICFEQVPDIPVTLNCSHTFCTSCIYEWLDRQQRTCPVCRDEIKSESSILRSLREEGILDNVVLI